MGLNSPIPVRLQDEARKASKILRSFTSGKDVDLDKVIPRSVLERAAGFAIFTVIKAGFVFSARAGSGVVIARTSDGSWSPPSAIGLGGTGVGFQAGAEVTDFLVVLNSRAAVKSFMSAGSLTLGGNLSVAVGPLGRNAEGSGALNAKGKVAAIYSYSKTKGLFGGVSVEGTVIVERQDANRLAYGSTVKVSQILSGQFDPPPWARGLIEDLDRLCGGGSGGQGLDGRGANGEYDVYDDLRREDQDRYKNGGYERDPWDTDDPEPWKASTKNGRSRSGSNTSSSYAFGDGIGGRGNTLSTPPTRSRASSIFGKGDTTGYTPANGSRHDYPDRTSNSPRPSLAKRASSLIPSFSGKESPNKRQGSAPSSESYNAGLTWDSSGPMTNTGRSRSGSNAQPVGDEDLLGGDWGDGILRSASHRNTYADRGNGGNDLLGTWSSDDKGISTSFAGMALNGGGGGGGGGSGSSSGNRSRSNSKPPAFGNIPEDDYIPHETESRFAKMSAPPSFGNGNGNGYSTQTSITAGGGGARKARPVSSFVSSSSTSSPFGAEALERRPFDDYFNPTSDAQSSASRNRTVPEPFLKPSLPPRRTNSDSRPNLAPKAGLGGGSPQDGYPRAVALYEFKAAQSGDLGFVKGDVIILRDKVGNGDWWKGVKAGTGGGGTGEGMFPKSYVEVLGIPKDLRGGLSRSELKSRMADPFE